MRARLAKIRFGMNANNGCTGPIFHGADCFVMTRRAKSTSNVTRADRWVGFTFQMGGSLLLFMDRGTVTIWHDGLPKEVIPEIPAERTSRFNDVIADPRGRVFCGTMSTPERKGRLYRVDPDSSCNLLLEEVGCSNGMAFDADCRSF